MALLLSSSKRKTCEALGKKMDVSGDTIGRLLVKDAPNLESFVVAAEKSLSKKQKVSHYR